jgi:uncharacterized protein YceK
MRYILLTLVVVLLLGCQGLQTQSSAAREHNRRATAVLVTSSEERVSDCRRVAEVTVAPPFPFLNQAFPELTAVGREESRNDLQREARRVGGDTVLQTGPRGGIAYECRPGREAE